MWSSPTAPASAVPVRAALPAPALTAASPETSAYPVCPPGSLRLASSPWSVRRRSNEYSVPPVTPEAVASSLAVTAGRSRTTASTASRLAPRGARARTGFAVPRAPAAAFAAAPAFGVDAEFASRPRRLVVDFREPAARRRVVRGGGVAGAGAAPDPVVADPSGELV